MIHVSHRFAGPLGDLPALAPPPLTPPHKGEGDTATVVANFANVWLKARPQQDSPPPCGEGLGVGVVPHVIIRPSTQRARPEWGST